MIKQALSTVARGQRGYSFLELLLAVFLLYLASIYLFSAFASGSRHMARSQEYSLTTMLARSKLERMALAPVESVLEEFGAAGNFSAPYQDYRWSVTIEDFSTDYAVVILQVHSPRGAKTELCLLRERNHHFGITCDPYTHQVTFAVNGDPYIYQRDQVTATTRRLLAPPKANLEATSNSFASWRNGALSGSPGRGFLWSVCNRGRSLAYTTFNEVCSVKQTGLIALPNKRQLQSPQIVGLAGDPMACRVYCADRANNGLWILNDEGSRRTWENSLPVSPDLVPLGEIRALAMDYSGSTLWVADSRLGCLRLLCLDNSLSRSTTYYEAEPEVGWWSGPLAPNLSGKMVMPSQVGSLGKIAGLATNPWSSLVYVINGQQLFTYLASSQVRPSSNGDWQSVSLPAALVKARPSGLACDPYANALYINTWQGDIWKYAPSSKQKFSLMNWR